MRDYVFHYSPFSALGLDSEEGYLDNDYSENAIERAYRQASRYCHPDRRRHCNVPLERWPTLTHLADSRDYVIGLLKHDLSALRIPPSQFENFPRSFNPRGQLQGPLTFPSWEISGFISCDECLMPVPEIWLNDHLASHDCHICFFCNTKIKLEFQQEHYLECKQKCDCENVEDMKKHVAKKHTCRICTKGCLKTATVAHHLEHHHKCACKPGGDLENHIRSEHMCCGEHHNNLKQHFWECHRCKCPGIRAGEIEQHYLHVQSDHRCPMCFAYAINLDRHKERNHICPACGETYKERASHILKEHLCEQCGIYCDDIEDHTSSAHYCTYCKQYYTNLDQHLRKDHYCERCNEQVSDLRRHKAKHCPLSSCPFLSSVMDSFLFHLSSTHSFLFCLGCKPAETQREAFSEHVITHKWSTCPACQISICREQLQSHLEVAHCWQKCAECPDLQSVYAKDHLRTSHAKQQCPECELELYEVDLEKHLVQCHSWKHCHFCEAVNEASSFDSHVKSTHQPRPCPECFQEHPSDTMSHHLRSIHSWTTCAFCFRVLSPEEAEEHVLENHVQCGICGQRFSQTALKSHEKVAHLLIDCQYCNKRFSIEDLPEHEITSHKLRACPDTNSKIQLPLETLSVHISEVHSQKLCWCGSHFKDLCQHIADHVVDYQQGKCGRCGERVEKSEASLHAWSHITMPTDDVSGVRSIAPQDGGVDATHNTSTNQSRQNKDDISALFKKFQHAFEVLVNRTPEDCPADTESDQSFAQASTKVLEEKVTDVDTTFLERAKRALCPCGYDDKRNYARHRNYCNGKGTRFGPKRSNNGEIGDAATSKRLKMS